MTINSLLKRRWIQWPLAFAFWTLIGLSYAFSFYIRSSKLGLDVTWWQAVSYSLVDWYVFAVLSIPVIWLARKFQFESGKVAKTLAIHIPGSIVFSIAYIVLRAAAGLLQSDDSFKTAFEQLLFKTWHFNLVIYWVIVAVTFAFEYYRKFRERELRALDLEKRLVQAKLQALQMQLNPHFLFNSLHSISALMHSDVDAADRMISRLSDLLRAALAGSETQEVPLREELGFLQRYLDIEQIRFGDRLTVIMTVPPETLDLLVPNLILQPIVENAIRHGIEPHVKPGRIEVRAQLQADKLNLEVSDNGAGLKDDHKETGVGLTNTRARLQTLYGDAHDFALTKANGGGLLVRLIIPASKENQL